MHLVSDSDSVYDVDKVNVVFQRYPNIPKHCPHADVIQAIFIHISFWTEFGGLPPYPGLKSEAPNNGSLLHVNKLKSLFDAIQSTFRSTEMLAKKCYKTWICLVILGELDCFWNNKSFRFIFPNILDALSRIMKVRTFLIPVSSHIFESKNFTFPFPLKIA